LKILSWMSTKPRCDCERVPYGVTPYVCYSCVRHRVTWIIWFLRSSHTSLPAGRSLFIAGQGRSAWETAAHWRIVWLIGVRADCCGKKWGDKRASDVSRLLGAAKLQSDCNFAVPKSREMSDAPLSLPFLLPLLIAAWVRPPLPSPWLRHCGGAAEG